MPQRTLRQARRLLDDNAASINPPQWREWDGEVNAAIKAATASAMEYFNTQYNEALGVCQATGQGLCEVRDAARVLTADLAAGRITAREGSTRWNQLRGQARRLAANTDQLHQQTERLAVIEAEPAEWFDGTFHERFPLTRPNFSF
jgi:hypothetical protein